MDWITDDIAIGNYLDAHDREQLSRHAVNSVLGLTEVLRRTDCEGLNLKAIEIVLLVDAPGSDPRMFRRAVDALTRLVHEARPVLVHCHAGPSRSIVVVSG